MDTEVDQGLRSLHNTLTSRHARKDMLMLRGMIDGTKAFTGPKHAEICITNYCNLDCIGCWMYSPNITEYPPNFSMKNKKQYLPMGLFTKAVDGLSSLGVTLIRITGMGEPMFHKDIYKMIAYVRDKGIYCIINTNGVLINRRVLDKLINAGLSSIHLSLWAGTLHAYVLTHPNQPPETFGKIADWLLYLRSLKETSQGPEVVLINVVCSKNHEDVINMVAFAKEVNPEYLFMGAVDTTRETKDLLLDKAAIDTLKRMEPTCHSILSSTTVRSNLSEFFETIRSQGAIRGNFDLGAAHNHACFHGWIHARILTDGKVSPCGFTNLIMGDLNTHSFQEIWYSAAYDEFRHHCMNGFFDPYFASSFCTSNCVYFRVNQRIGRCIDQFNEKYLYAFAHADQAAQMSMWEDEIAPLLKRSFIYHC